MSKSKRNTYLVGIAYSGDAIVLLPKPGGYDLPLFEKKGFLKRRLIKGLEEKGFEGVRIVKRLDRIDRKEGDAKVRYIAFVFAYEKMNQAFECLPLDSKVESAPELAKNYLWRCDVYAPLYKEMERTVPLLEPEAKKVKKERECLTYHRRIIGKKTLKEFCALCDSASSIRRINEAFVAICNTYHVNPNRTPDSPRGNGKKEAKK